MTVPGAMETRYIHELAASCAGTLVKGEGSAQVRRVTIDSRAAKPGDLFVAVRGEHHDGHEYVADAARRGAVCAVVDKLWHPPDGLDCAFVVVEETRQALNRMANWYRNSFDIPVIAVVGSNGKTTTKNLLAAVLSQRFNTLSSEASFNNDIGVPLTLLRLERSHQVAVLEAGTNHPGELGKLLETIRPSLGVLTSVGREHLEFFGDVQGVLLEEGVIAGRLPREGVLFVNEDSVDVSVLATDGLTSVVRVGTKSNDWRLSSIRVEDSGTSFLLRTRAGALDGWYRTRLLGAHQAVNAALALAVGSRLGLRRDELDIGLQKCQPAPHRLTLFNLAGLRVLDDSYNANADSMRAALQTAGELVCTGRRIAVLGDMAEQGEQSANLHAEIGRHAVALGIRHLFVVGRWARVYAQAARAVGSVDVREFADRHSAASELIDFVREGDFVLVKASRAAKLEEVVEALRMRRVAAARGRLHGEPDGRGGGLTGCGAAPATSASDRVAKALC